VDETRLPRTACRRWRSGRRRGCAAPQRANARDGILGPSARLRSDAVAAARALLPVDATLDISPEEDRASDREPLVTLGLAASSARGANDAGAAHGSVGGSPSRGSSGSEPRPHTSWAELLRRTFEIDVLACRECGGRLRLLATIEDPAVVKKILSHLGIATECPRPAPARPPPETAGFFDFGGGW